MRQRLVVGAVLAAMLTGLLMLSVYMMDSHQKAMDIYYAQCAELEQRTAELEEKEQQLEQLQAEEAALLEKVDEMTAQAETLEKEKTALLTETEQILSSIDSIRQNLQGEDSDQSYYLEVYDALTEGLNKVKGYIAGN